MPECVLITGARAAAALDIARDFRAAGWEPHLADCSPARIARWSAAAASVHRYPSPASEGEGFRRRIAELADRLGVRLVVPTCEEVFHLAAPTLSAPLAGRLFAPPLALLRRLHDKLGFAKACAEWKLPVPESHAIDTPHDLGRFADQAEDWVFKPRFSRFGEAALVGPSRSTLASLAFVPGQGLLAQRRVRGGEASFYAVAHRGELTAFSAYRSDWRMRGGASYAFEPLPASQAQMLRALAAALARAADLSGQFACDVMIDAAGNPWLIECNPRATSGVHLFAGDGRLARAIIGDAHSLAEPPPVPAYLGPAMWVFGLPAAIGSKRVAAWRQAMAHGRDVLARPGDRLPMFGALVDSLGFSLAARKHGITMSAATTRDIEWNGEDLP